MLKLLEAKHAKTFNRHMAVMKHTATTLIRTIEQIKVSISSKSFDVVLNNCN